MSAPVTIVNWLVSGPLPIELRAENRLRLIDLGGGDSIPSILAILSRLSRQYGENPAVRQAAESIIHPAANNDTAGHWQKITRWVKSRMVYTADPLTVEYVKSPLTCLREIADKGVCYGDCDDHVLLANSLAQSLGLPTRILGVKLHHDYFDHVISSAYVNGDWRDVDLCNKGFGPDPVYLERMAG